MWKTFHGTVIPINELSHQHLSNIFWFYEIVINFDVPHEINVELQARFGGIRLPYRPTISFKGEIDTLLNLGLITNRIDSDIIKDGRWIGKLNYS